MASRSGVAEATSLEEPGSAVSTMPKFAPGKIRHVDRQIALALTSAAAAAIHFAVTGDHFEEALLAGLFFSVVAWGQAIWSGLAVLAPSRGVLLVGALGNLGVVGIWAASRTTGVPIGPNAWTAEKVGAADLLATALELVIVVGCLLLIAGHPRGRRDGQWGGPGPLLVFGVALAVLTSWTIATGGDHAHVGAAASHSHNESASHGAHAPPPSGARHSGPFHVHPDVHEAGTPDPEQMDLIQSAMERYADVDAARADGYERMDGDYEGTGAHFGIPEWTSGGAYSITGRLDLTQPEYLMYTKRLTGEWKLVAVAFVLDMWQYPEPSTDLVGAPYHEHVWNCIESEGWTLDEEEYGYVSHRECEAEGNIWSPGGEWMTHVWLIPNPDGVFADENPTIR